MSTDIDTVKAEFESAVAVARHALEEFNAEPLVPAQRGSPRISASWRVYREASEIAVKWYRELRALRPAELHWSDHELDRLLDEAAGEGS